MAAYTSDKSLLLRLCAISGLIPAAPRVARPRHAGSTPQGFYRQSYPANRVAAGQSLCVLVFAFGTFLLASTYEAICAGGSMQDSASGLIGRMRMYVAFVISAASTLLPMRDQPTAVIAVICVASLFSILLIARCLRPAQKVRISGARR